MTKIYRITGTIVIAALLSIIGVVPAASAETVPTNMYYDDISLSGGFASGNFPQVWDLTAGCGLTISFTVDLNGIADDDPDTSEWAAGDHAWSELGVRDTSTTANFNPSAKGVWLATDYNEASPPAVNNTFAPDPPGSPTQDIDDKFILQRVGGQGEAAYNLPSVPPIPWDNHRMWFDRDGVDEWQAQNPLAVDGGTYNTEGTYHVVITLQATDVTNGTAYMTINGLDQGFETDVPKDWTDMELTPAGMAFTGDMTHMQVFYGLYGYDITTSDPTHSVTFSDITVEGCLVLEEGMATGGGWFIPEPDKAIGLTNLGGKATFGFVAKQKNDTSSGQLEFQYHADELNLKSTSYDWVTLSNTQVIFEGVGRLNGEDGYKFRVWAFDGDKAGGQPDRFTIRIWPGNDSYESPTHRAEGDLDGGQIVVHKK